MPVMPEAADLRTFIREIMRRFERQQEAVIAELVEQRETWQTELRAQRETWQSELRDLREESRAQRQALLLILDRLDGGAASA